MPEFKADRMRATVYPGLSRLTYMAHANGYVMVRHPGCMPFVVTEADWLSLWVAPSPGAPQ